MNTVNLEKKRIKIAIIAVFLLLFIFRCIAIDNKTNLYFDEPASFIVSTPNNTLNNDKFKILWSFFSLKEEHNYIAIDLKKALFESKANAKSIIKDILSIRNETIDHSHPNLYYSILRIWTIGIDYSNQKSMILRGCSLNLIFFTFSFFFMYKLLNLIKKDDNFLILGLFFAFINTGSISNTLMIRPYPLQETLLILVIYHFLILYRSIDSYKPLKLKEYFLYSISTCLYLLSGYNSLILVILTFAALIIKCIKQKQFNCLKEYIAILLLAVAFTGIIFPNYFTNLLFMEHGNAVRTNANLWNYLNFSDNSVYLFKFFNNLLFYNATLFIMMAVAVLYGFPVLNNNKYDNDNKQNIILILGIVFFWTYIISIVSPFHDAFTVRYIIPSFPILSLLYTMFAYKIKQAFVAVIIFVTFFTSIIPTYRYISEIEMKNKNFGTVMFSHDLKRLDIREFLYNKNKELLPVVCVKRDWIWPNFIFYLPNETIVRIEKKEPKSNYIFDEYLLINRQDVKRVLKDK